MSSAAILLGCNNFEYPMPLKGCVNDLRTRANFIANDCNMDGWRIEVLVNERMTYDNTDEKVRRIIGESKANDRIYIGGSSHGSRAAVRNPDGSIKGISEIFITHEFNWNKQAKWLTDEYWIERLKSLHPDAICEINFDACNSDGILDGVQDRNIVLDTAGKFDGVRQTNPRYLPPDFDIEWRTQQAIKQNIAPSSTIVRAINDGVLKNVTYVSGCGRLQTSADVTFGGKSFGAFTDTDTAVLRNNSKETPRKLIVQAVCESLRNQGYSQQPVISGGREDQPFLLRML